MIIMKLKVLDETGNAVGEIELPLQFSEPLREDLIKKAVLAIQNNSRQAYGNFEDAGDRHAIRLSKRRRDYKTPYGKGMSRTPRKTLSRRGSQMHWVGAQAPNTVGGRRAHPPKAEKVWAWKLNDSERRKAIRSALSATISKKLVQERGHVVPDNYPFVLHESFESIDKTAKLISALGKLGFAQDLCRGEETSTRAGRSKLRGRSKKSKKSILFVVSEGCKATFAAKNLPGVDIVSIKKLNTELLAPGTHYGRATLFTTKAVDELKRGLFTSKYNPASSQKKELQAKQPAKPKKKE
jgi:large subunit ribosomal protein L4e